MKISEIIQVLEKVAPPSYQESYDNAGLLTGNSGWQCTGIVCSLDSTEAVILEAKAKGCNLVVTHHPIIFSGLKKINGKNYVEKAVIAAVKNDIGIYAIHTNLDNVMAGVNNRMADQLGLINRKILLPKSGQLMKLFTFVPLAQAEQVRSALFEAGAGHIGNYSEVSFNAKGTGTFKAGEAANPFIGEIGSRHTEDEIKIEVIFPNYMKTSVISALFKSHPYEEVAYDLASLANDHQQVGSGLIGELSEALAEEIFLNKIREAFGLSIIRHTNLLGKSVKKVALCGGAGSFLISKAALAAADFYITADVKYHEFFDANDLLVIADIGHWESEQYTIDLLFDILTLNFPNFAVLKTEVRTNPVFYFS